MRTTSEQDRGKTAVSLHKYFQGRDDCIEGIPSRSDHPDYLRGYGNAYALEQCITAHYLFEPVHKELNKMEIEIDLMRRDIR